MRTVRLLISCMMAMACTAQVQAPPETMSVQVWPDRTALYPGDRLQYVALVEHSPDIEFVQEHVRKDQLSLEPFEILDVKTSSTDLPGGRKAFEVRLLLTTYEVNRPDATVPSFNLFYFRRSQSAGKDNVPAETLAVPPLKIGLRSTIVDPPGILRDYKPILPVSQTEWMLPGLLGMLGVLAVLVYGASLALKWARSGFWKRKMTERIRKKSIRESFEEIRTAPVDSPERVETFYAKAATLLRELAAEQLGDCGGLTPREMQSALQKSGDRGDHAEMVGDLMEQCDLVRYSPDGAESARARHPEFLQKFSELIERR
jgi:hypothetical protein